MAPISVNTLQEYRDNGWDISASCTRCGHFSWLDLDGLIEKLGPDMPVGGNPAFRRRLACGRC